MAFKDIDQRLINECSQNKIDIEKIKALIEDGANVNAFDEEYEQELYDAILDYYIDEEPLNLSNLYEITKLFLENNLILNHKPEDNDYFLPRRFRFLPPEKVCVNIFKLLLEKGKFSFALSKIVISPGINALIIFLAFSLIKAYVSISLISSSIKV